MISTTFIYIHTAMSTNSTTQCTNISQWKSNGLQWNDCKTVSCFLIMVRTQLLFSIFRSATFKVEKRSRRRCVDCWFGSRLWRWCRRVRSYGQTAAACFQRCCHILKTKRNISNTKYIYKTGIGIYQNNAYMFFKDVHQWVYI